LLSVRGSPACRVRLKFLPAGQPAHSLDPGTIENDRDDEESDDIEHIQWSQGRAV